VPARSEWRGSAARAAQHAKPVGCDHGG
jgi:hypothetical protein